jgi:hypothetical protein
MANSKISASLATILMLGPTSALAADWGYDDSKKPTELKASPAKSLSGKTASPGASQTAAPQKGTSQKSGNPFSRTPAPQTEEAPATATASPLPATPAASHPASHTPSHPQGKTPAHATAATKSKPAVSAGKATPAIEDWIELYELVSKEQITADQKARYKEALEHKLTTPRGIEVSQISEFWPEVRGRIKSNDDQKAAFAAFFRSLLRFVLKSKNVTEDDSTILNELLGPERIAVPGDPPLTEDSVDAYGDMACFLYEQAHPGKSVDAIDNRTVFASVIARKYTEAPTDKDKRAMSNFSLTWSKFKVMWLSANESDRKQLYEQVAMGKPPNADIKDPLITTIFAHGPWHSKQ